MTSFVDIDVELDWNFDIEPLVDSLLEAVMDFENCEYEAQVNLLITDENTVHVYNKEYRGIDRTTDVLSFPALDFNKPGEFVWQDEDEAAYFDPDSGELMLGDIVINKERVISQAEEYGHSIKREFAFLVTHSLFHLCGYDHETPEEAKNMENKQETILNKLDIRRDN